MTGEKKLLLEAYNQGLTAYKQKKWKEAVVNFEKALEIDPDDGPSRLYLQRSTAYLEVSPPDDWDGVFVMTTK